MSFFEIYGGKLYDLLDVLLLYMCPHTAVKIHVHAYNRHYIEYR